VIDTNISLRSESLYRQEELKEGNCLSSVNRALSGVIKEGSIVRPRRGKFETRKEFQFQTLAGRPPRIRLYGMVIMKWILSK